MDEHHRIEREADEAFAAFRKKWPGNDAGDPTCVELWHHAWRAAVAAERERLRVMLIAHLDQTVISHHVSLAECHAARNALQLVLDEWA